MMQISPEIQLFIREHSSDDVRVLALQAKKYPDIDMPTAITQDVYKRQDGNRFSAVLIATRGVEEKAVYGGHCLQVGYSIFVFYVYMV